MDEQEKYQKLIDRLLLGEQLTAEEQELLEVYYNRFEEQPDVLDQMSDHEVSVIEQKLRDRLENHIEKAGNNSRRIRLKQFSFILRVAAALLLFSFVSIYGYLYFFQGENWRELAGIHNNRHFQVAEVYRAQDEVRQVQLSDGTLVFLNAYSTLEVDLDFGKGNRQVNLTGEAYFDVAKRTEVPFIVYNKGTQVEVLGTSFWVNERDMSNYVTLVTGKIQFSDDSESITMHPKERLSKSSGGDYLLGKADLSLLQAWKPGGFSFQNVSVADFFGFLQDRFSLDIKVSDATIKDCKITTMVDGSESWQELLVLVCLANGFTYEEFNGYILIDGPGCLK